MQHVICTLPLARLPLASSVASNADQFNDPYIPTQPTQSTCKANVRWLRHAQDTDCHRFALSGRLADVCAVLDELADQEVRNAWKCASY